jgi:methionyl-tRNA synthetase
MTGRPTFMISTAIPYANGSPHIGHAYERVVTDAIARFHRLDGRDVFFITGMDEHGLKVQQTAQREQISPPQFVDRIAVEFETLGSMLHAPTDDFIRTTQPRHMHASQALWERMKANGDIYLSKYSGWYSVRDEAYYDESELTDGPDGKRAPTGTPVQWVEEESYFFRLSAYGERLLALYEQRPDFIVPAHYRNEIVAFVKRGLADLSISRTTFNWGVPVPGDPAHVMYVWVDALTNYITGAGYPDPDAPRARYWRPEGDNRVVHVIGKDITRFHAVYWPAFLMSAGVPLPSQVVVHGFLFNRGEKMSKSVGNVIDPASLVAAYGVDPFRYFLLRETPFGQDGSYSHEAIVQRINADLANDLGNLAQRSLTMIAKNCDAAVPSPAAFTAADEAILAEAYAIGAKVRATMADYGLHLMLAEIWRVVAEANRYFAGQEPWALRKTDPARMATVLYVTAEVLRVVAIFAQPAMPERMAMLLDALGVAPDARDFAAATREHRLSPGAPLPAPKPLFPRYVEPDAPAA